MGLESGFWVLASNIKGGVEGAGNGGVPHYIRSLVQITADLPLRRVCSRSYFHGH